MDNRKRYSPAHIKNPTSMQHIVWLQPGQTFFLHLKKDQYPSAKIEISTDNLKYFDCDNSVGEHQYLFIQDAKTTDWANYSSCCLGEVWIDSDHYTSRLVVMLACENSAKKNVITAINPDCTDIRIKPYGLLEVIVYDLRFHDQDEWVWEWRPLMQGLGIEEIGHDSMNLSMWDRYYTASSEQPNYLYARCPRADSGENRWARQHHFWFRFTDPIIDLINQDLGLKSVGNLRFYGYPERFNKKSDNVTERFLSLTVDLKDKYRMMTLETLGLKPQNETQPIVGPPVRAAVVGHLRKNRHRDRWPRHFIKDVAVMLLDTNGLEGGCKTVNALPAVQTEYYDRELDCCDHPCQTGPNHHSRFGVHGMRDYPMDDDYREIYDWWQ